MKNGLKMKTEVVNKKWGGCEGEGFVYIGRGSEFGNPFRIGADGSRAEVVEKYREWFLRKVCDPAFRRQVWALEGKKLVCFCAPRQCHRDVLKWWLELDEDGVREE